MSIRISKSKFCAGVQCLKRLYFEVHSPELAEEPSAADQAIIQQGHEVGMLARPLFPRGVEVCERSLDQAIRTTRELVANPEIPAIFEGVFEHGGVLVKVDILHRRRDGRWRLIEVKSTSDVILSSSARLLRFFPITCTSFPRSPAYLIAMPSSRYSSSW